MTKYRNIVIIGSGKLATNLAIVFKSTGHNILQIYSRNIENAKVLADRLSCIYTDNPEKINKEADLFFIAVSDNAVCPLLDKMTIKNKFIIHTAGSLNIDILGKYSENYGVFYPVQTFSKTRLVNFKKIPVCIEANNSSNEKILHSIASEISDNVYTLNSEQRMYVHLAAVFASNFVNHLYTISDTILTKNNIPFEILKPLINEVTEKALTFKPIECQTGPAVRNDESIIESHLRLLSKFPDFKNIYTFVTKSIYELHSSNIQNHG